MARTVERFAGITFNKKKCPVFFFRYLIIIFFYFFESDLPADFPRFFGPWAVWEAAMGLAIRNTAGSIDFGVWLGQWIWSVYALIPCTVWPRSARALEAYFQ